jgi:hypothetical protein
MEPLPMAQSPCSLDPAGLDEQLARYRLVGQAAAVLSRSERRIVLRVNREVPARLVEELVEVERGCCPFFELDWQPADRRLSVAVASADGVPALEAIVLALGAHASPTDREPAENPLHRLVIGEIAPKLDP